MTDAQARTTANVVMAAAAVGAAYYVLRTPPLRRAAWQLGRRWAVGPLAAWLVTEVRRAWDASASAAPTGRNAAAGLPTREMTARYGGAAAATPLRGASSPNMAR